MPYDILCGNLDCKHNRPVGKYYLRDGRIHKGGCCIKVGIVLDRKVGMILNEIGIITDKFGLLMCQDYTKREDIDATKPAETTDKDTQH